MNTPKIDDALQSSPTPASYLSKFNAAVALIEQGVADKKMYNVDYENAKYYVNEGCEKALSAAAEPWRDVIRNRTQNQFDSNDPRWNIGYYVLPIHAQGFLKKLRNPKIPKTPEIQGYMTVLEEVAQVGELMKQIKPFIIKGRKPNPNPGPAPDLSNTGTCPVCFNTQKLTFDSRMVDHGYQVPHGYGGRAGHCIGFKHMPYELSSEGNVYFKGMLESQKKANVEYLRRLNAREVSEFTRHYKMYKGPGKYEHVTEVTKKGEPKYEGMVTTEITKVERDQEFLTSDIATQTKLIADWKLQPLKYGGPETQERWKTRVAPKP